jgi:hypothetical protein
VQHNPQQRSLKAQRRRTLLRMAPEMLRTMLRLVKAKNRTKATMLRVLRFRAARCKSPGSAVRSIKNRSSRPCIPARFPIRDALGVAADPDGTEYSVKR